jgi:hypothetical protein
MLVFAFDVVLKLLSAMNDLAAVDVALGSLRLLLVDFGVPSAPHTVCELRTSSPAAHATHIGQTYTTFIHFMI